MNVNAWMGDVGQWWWWRRFSGHHAPDIVNTTCLRDQELKHNRRLFWRDPKSWRRGRYLASKCVVSFGFLVPLMVKTPQAPDKLALRSHPCQTYENTTCLRPQELKLCKTHDLEVGESRRKVGGGFGATPRTR